MLAELVAIELIMLTKLDGRVVYVNPNAISHLAEPRGEESEFQQLPLDVKCVVVMNNKTWVSVRESCAEIRKLFVEDGK